MDDSEAKRLDEYSSEELMLELLHRHHHGVIVLLNTDPDEHFCLRQKWIGNSHTCMRLCAEATLSIREDAQTRTTEI
jgi:hypothetical protein